MKEKDWVQVHAAIEAGLASVRQRLGILELERRPTAGKITYQPWPTELDTRNRLAELEARLNAMPSPIHCPFKVGDEVENEHGHIFKVDKVYCNGKVDLRRVDGTGTILWLEPKDVGLHRRVEDA